MSRLFPVFPKIHDLRCSPKQPPGAHHTACDIPSVTRDLPLCEGAGADPRKSCQPASQQSELERRVGGDADPPPAGHQGPRRKRQCVPGVLPEAGRRSSVGPAAGLQVRPFAGGQHPGMVSWLRKRPLVAPPVGPSAVPLADVPIQDVLDVLHNQVDGNCGRQTRAA